MSLTFLLVCPLVLAEQASSLLVVSSDDSKLTTTIAAGILERYPSANLVALDALDTTQINSADTIISLGNRACENLLLKDVRKSVKCGLISQSFDPGNIANFNFHYLPMEVPLTYFLRMSQLVVEDIKTVGILVGPHVQPRQGYFDKLVTSRGLSAEWAILEMDSNPVLSLDPVMRKGKVFIVLPDNASFNRAVAPWVLQLSLRYRVPVLAYSFSYANAGALASLYQSEDDILHNLINAIEGQNLATLNFSIRLNYAVARNLGIELKSEDYYLENIHKAGH